MSEKLNAQPSALDRIPGKIEDTLSRTRNRRGVLKVLGAGLASALVSGCGDTLLASPGKTPTETPTQRPPRPTNEKPEPTSSPTAEVKINVSPTPESISPFPLLTADTFLTGYFGIGGEKVISMPTSAPDGGRQVKETPVPDLFRYAADLWDLTEEEVANQLATDPVMGVKFSFAAAELTGIEGVINFEEAFPQLKDVKIPRFTLGTLPQEKEYEVAINSAPRDFVLRKGTHMHVLGVFGSVSGPTAIVAFDDFLRTPDGSPKMELVAIPVSLERPETGTSLVQLVRSNGGLYDAKTQLLTLPNGETLVLPVIETTFGEQLYNACGVYFMDEIGKNPDGTPILHPRPVVPRASPEFVKEVTEKNNVMAIAYGPTENHSVVMTSPDGKTQLAEVTYNKETNQWEWKEIKPSTLELTLTSLTPELAVKFIAGGEYVDLASFENRVFLEGNSGGMVLLTQEVLEKLSPSLSSEGINAIVQSAWGAILEERPKEYMTKGTGVTPSYILSMDVEGNPVVFFLTGDDKTGIDKYYVGHVGRMRQGEKPNYDKIPLYGYDPEEMGSQWTAVEQYDFRLHDRTGELVADDGFQIGAILTGSTQKTYEWTPILPHERRDGRAELLSPEQRVRKELAMMKEITGYDDTGLWENVTDENGIPYTKVHATQDQNSKVVYEVILDTTKDPRGIPQMFTIRECDYNDETGGKIVGLNDAQASLTRQAWRILETADPYVDEQDPGFLEKSWRVNKGGA